MTNSYITDGLTVRTEPPIDMAEAYMRLTVMIPLMIVFLSIIAVIMTLILIDVSRKMGNIRQLLANVFADKIDEINRDYEQEERLQQEIQNATKKEHVPISKSRKITIGILAGSIPPTYYYSHGDDRNLPIDTPVFMLRKISTRRRQPSVSLFFLVHNVTRATL